MAVFGFLAISFFIKFLSVLFVICSVILVLIILIQKGKGGGLSGALGGMGGAGGILGTKTGDFLTWVTVSLVGVFLFLAVVLAKYYKPAIVVEPGEGQVQQSSQQDGGEASE